LKRRGREKLIMVSMYLRAAAFSAGVEVEYQPQG
jgi:hypothetical protein